MTKLSLFGAVSAVLVFFSACQKHYDDTTATNTLKQSSSVGSLTDQLEVTPFGMMPQKNVHFIDAAYSLSMIEGHVKKTEKESGKVIEDFGTVEKLDDNLNAAKKAMDNYLLPAAASGWIAYSYWANTDTTAHPVTYFSTTWAVPSAPTRQSNQTVFLFNGMQNGVASTFYIIQPVLQWGVSAAGGGKYWAISNWFVSGGQAYYSALQTVSSGTVLQGVLQQTSHNGTRYNYNSSFAGYSVAESLQITNVPQAWWCAETLETYSVTSSNQYPPDRFTEMKSIKMLENSTNAPLNWSTAKASGNIPQRAVIVTNGSPDGEVDLYYRK